MPTYTWNPPAPAQFVDWNTPADWLPTTVPNAADADVVIPEITDSSGNPYDFFVTIGATESYLVNSLTLVQQYLILDGTLAISAGLTMGAGSEIDITGSLSLGSLSNTGAIDIQGSGQISSPGSIENQGDIVGSGLTLAVAGFGNTGTLAATGVFDVNVGAGGFANLVGGTLSLGTYDVLAGGVLSLSVAGAITADAATIELNDMQPSLGAVPTLETQAGSLAQTLQSITPDGVLKLMGMNFADTTSLAVAGTLQIDTGTLSAAGLTVLAGGIIAGSGTIASAVTNDGTVAAQGSVNASDGAVGGTMMLAGAVDGTGTLDILAAEINDEYVATYLGNTLEIAGADTNTVSFADWNGTLVLNSPSLFAGRIEGFTTGSNVSDYPEEGPRTSEVSDSIILPGLSASTVKDVAYSGTAAGGTLTFESGTTSVALDFVGSYDLGDFVFSAGPQALSSSPPSIDITEVLPCFLAGTRLLTEHGEVAVERLAVGDLVQTEDGGLAPVRWIGHRRVDANRHPRADDVWPIRVRENAFGMGRPHRDLWLSPDHAVFAEGVLIPIRYLRNGTTIVQSRRSPVVYFHVELLHHDVVLADGLPCESYLDLGNRAAFANGGVATVLHPGFGKRVWEREGCAELILGGPVLQRVRAQLQVQAGLLATSATPSESAPRGARA
jgi:hypothetical protein